MITAQGGVAIPVPQLAEEPRLHRRRRHADWMRSLSRCTDRYLALQSKPDRARPKMKARRKS
jgi:hypothetical protein